LAQWGYDVTIQVGLTDTQPIIVHTTTVRCNSLPGPQMYAYINNQIAWLYLCSLSYSFYGSYCVTGGGGSAPPPREQNR
jgi:hypothetical protein